MRIVLLAALAAFSLVAKDTKIDEPKKDLRLFYLQNCARCHGEDGSATRPDGKKLGGRDFTSEKDMKGETDESMAKTIRKGIFFGAVMPSFKKQLSEEETLWIVKEIVRKAQKGKPVLPPQ
jgi:mono/diheme cytochrome c family protein